jgi:formiminotetrahydrofolate cyclodeaminase
MLSSPDFLDRLSSADPVPGGGSVAALQTAMAAALAAMVANLTIGRPKYADVEDEARAIRDEALTLRHRAAALANEDEEAYGRVAAVLSLPRDTDDERAERRRRMQDALKGAVFPPLETMRTASAVIRLAGRLAVIGNRSAISDVGSAALAAHAGYRAAQLNVEINLAAIRDADWVANLRGELAALPAPTAAEREILSITQAAITGTST